MSGHPRPDVPQTPCPSPFSSSLSSLPFSSPFSAITSFLSSFAFALFFCFVFFPRLSALTRPHSTQNRFRQCRARDVVMQFMQTRQGWIVVSSPSHFLQGQLVFLPLSPNLYPFKLRFYYIFYSFFVCFRFCFGLCVLFDLPLACPSSSSSTATTFDNGPLGKSLDSFANRHASNAPQAAQENMAPKVNHFKICFRFAN